MIRSLIRKLTTPAQRVWILNALGAIKGALPQGGDKFEDFQHPYKLHLGCGNIKLGFSLNRMARKPLQPPANS